MRFNISRSTPALLLAPLAATAASAQTVEWVWSGAVTTSSVVIKAKVTGHGGGARLRVATSEDPAEAVPLPSDGRLSPDANGIAAARVEGLRPDTRYAYSVSADGRSALHGRFRTVADGPMSFRIVFGSCATTGSNHRVFTAMRELNPLFFLHMGDFHYENIGENDPEEFRNAFDEVLTTPRQAALYRHAPIAYVWDDHDYGRDDADGSSPSRPAALATYRQYVPHYPLVPRPDGTIRTIQQSFSVGRIAFILTDVRSDRDPEDEPDGPGKTMLGEIQRRWLFDELERARDEHALVVWVNVVPWITKADPGTEDGWERYSHERRLIADKIEALGLDRRLLMLSGDGHMMAIDDGTNSNYATNAVDGPAFPVMHAAPLDRYSRVKGGPYSHGTHVEKSFIPFLSRSRQFGLMEVTDTGRSLLVRLSGRDSDGEVLPGMQLSVLCREDEEGCRIVEGSEIRARPPAR